MTKTLYLIAFYFAPLGRADGVNRAYLSRYLADKGWNIKVICAEKPYGLLRNYQTDPSLLEVLGPRVKRYGVPYRAGIRNELTYIAGLKPDPFTHWIPDALAEARKQIDGPGLIMAITPPVTNALIAWQLSKETGLPFVLDFRDDEFDLPFDCVQSSSVITASTDYSLNTMKTHYRLNDSGRHDFVYYNGYPDIEDDPKELVGAELDQTRLIYGGLLHWKHDPAIVARAARRVLKRRPELAKKLKIDYYGPKNYYTRMALSASPASVGQLKGYVSFREMRKEMSRSTLGISSLIVPSQAYCIPSKVFQYLSAGLPILAVTPPGALSALINQYDLGICVPPKPRSALEQALENILDSPEQLAHLRKQVADKRGEFSLRNQVEKLDATITGILP